MALLIHVCQGDMIIWQQGMGYSFIMTTASYTVPLEDEMKKMYASYEVWDPDDKIIEFPQKKAL